MPDAILADFPSSVTPDSLGPDDSLIVDGLDWSWAFVVFRRIAGFDEYAIGSDGSVWSHKDSPAIAKRWRGQWRKLATVPTSHGYREVTLRTPTHQRRDYVHNLVLEAFVGSRPASPRKIEACHWNRRKNDNRLCNLRWDTIDGNARDRDRHGTLRHGRQIQSAKLTESDVREIRSLVESGMLHREVAAIYGVSRSRISYIVHRKNWARVK